ncbi:MAG TPA: Na+/H+ antiporter subunit E [Thermodesulfobacteriota bacterium]
MPLALLLVAWLAVVWVLVADRPSVGSLAAGLVVGGLVVAVLGPPRGRITAAGLGSSLALGATVLVRTVRSSVGVARVILGPARRFRPGLVVVPLGKPLPGAGLAAVTVLTTLSPGTVVLDVSEDGRSLYVHAIDARDPEAIRREVAAGTAEAVAAIARTTTPGGRRA